MKKFLLILIIIIAIFLRIWHLDLNPPSLYWDEASLGYNAYSILLSGADEHGEKLPLDRFIAFGDYKPPGYIYSTVFSMAVFGPNEFAVRFPSAMGGILMVILTYFLTKKLLTSVKVSLLASFLLAVSPWSIHLSRAAFEANLAAFFNLAAVFFFLKAKKKASFFILSVIFFVLSFYTFNANRIIAPVFLISLIFIHFKFIRQNLVWYIAGFILAGFFILPSTGFLRSRESRLRFQEVSIFNSIVPVEIANARISNDGNTAIARLIHNRRLLFLADYLKHLSDNFSGRFLFTHGDGNPRLSVQGMGQLYFWELPFAVAGLFFLILYKRSIIPLIFAWMAISVIPAGAARETPHALRIVSILPSYQIITAFGLYRSALWLKDIFSRKNYIAVIFVSGIIFVFNFYYYIHLYHIHFPSDWAGQWQYGYKQMVNYVLNIKSRYDRIFITSTLGRPYIFFAFYKPYLPSEFQKEKKVSRDWFGFYEVEALGKISFDTSNLYNASGRILYVGSENMPPVGFRFLATINSSSREPVFYIWEKT